MATLVVASVGMSADLRVMGRDYVNSCGYFSAMNGDYQVTYTDRTLPWGTKVTAIYGWDVEHWNHPPKTIEWQDREEKEMKAISPFVWGLDISTQLHSRSSNQFKKALDLTIKIQVPNEPVRYFNGGTTWGFFQTEVGNTSKAPCVGRDRAKPEFYERVLSVVKRDR